MISIDLSGKTILITGALGAIAGHMVRRLSESGATLVLTDIKAADEAKRTLEDWKIAPSSYLYHAADITESSQVEAVVSAAFERFPGMDTVVGHAGGCGLHPFASTSEADYERIFRFNYFAQTYLARSVLARWTQRGIAGHLIFTSSYVARMPHSQISSYASAIRQRATFCANSSASAPLKWSVRAKNQGLSSITIQVSRSRGSASITPFLSNFNVRSGTAVHIEEPVRSKNVTPSTPSELITYSHCGSVASATIT